MIRDIEHYKRYGWKCSEENLKTLPPTAPDAARDLAKWLTLEGRRSSLEEWLGCVSDDGRIHGKFWHIGAWTHRMSHSSPNQANIPACWPKDKHGNPIPPTSAVEEVKYKYDDKLRALFKTEHYLVGADAEGIQLRVLAHYMESEDYRDAILSGVKELETDIHNLNKKALGPICRTRDDAKTFIYAWLLGAGLPKIAAILRCSVAQAKQAEANFLKALPELKKLKEWRIPRDAKRGWFEGVDGRRVPCNSEHLMLAGYLQNAESTIMKHATVWWTREAKAKNIRFRLVDLVHDEWQVECPTYEEAEKIGELMCQSLTEVGKKFGMFCDLTGDYRIGKNWKETH